MEALHEQEETKHEDERYVELVSEDCESQERFRNEHPCLVIKALPTIVIGEMWRQERRSRTTYLDLSWLQRPKEHSLQYSPNK